MKISESQLPILWTKSRDGLSHGCDRVTIKFFYLFYLLLIAATLENQPVGHLPLGNISVPPSVPPQILCRVDYVQESPVPGVHRHVHLNNVTKLWRSMNETLKPMGMEKTKVPSMV